MKIDKKLSRPAIILAALAALVLVLSACGNDDEASVDAGSASDDGETTGSDTDSDAEQDTANDPDSSDDATSDDTASDEASTDGESSADDATGDDSDASDQSDDEASPSGDEGGTEQTLPPLGAGPYPIATLEISVSSSESDAAPVAYTVSCLGDTATISPSTAGLSDQTACELLNDPGVRTRLIDGPNQDLMCTQVYGGPEEARITGTIDDQPVDTVITRSDGCGINDWDVLLAGILPSAGAS